MKKNILILILLILTIPSKAQVSMQSTDDGILITDSGDEVFFYQIESRNVNGKKIRNNYIPRLWSIDGINLTKDIAEGQLNKNGVFWAWPQVWVGGTPAGNPWEFENFEQNVMSVEFIRSKGGTGILMTEVFWSSSLWTVNGEQSPFIKENTTITVNPEQNNYRKIEFEFSFVALEGGVLIGSPDSGIGGFAMGMNFPDDVTFTNTSGEMLSEYNGEYSDKLLNIYGSVGKNDRDGGIILIDQSKNQEIQQLWNIEVSQGFVNPAFPGKRLVPVSSSEPLILKYILIVYSGEMSERKLSRILENQVKH